jgi:hypothetical protein
MAIRGMDIAAETIGIRYRQNCLRAFEIDRLFQISMRKEVLRAAPLTTLKLPLSHCIFRPMASSERTALANRGGNG